jgi:phage-related protein
MKFKVVKTKEADKDFNNLSKEDQKLLEEDYSNIHIKGIKSVNTKPLDTSLFEIKTKHLRSLYGYQKDKIILVTVIFIKDGQKTPKELIKRAKKILKNHDAL